MPDRNQIRSDTYGNVLDIMRYPTSILSPVRVRPIFKSGVLGPVLEG